MKKLKGYEKLIKKNYPNDYQDIIIEMNNIYKFLCKENATQSKNMQKHTFDRIYPAISVYKAIKKINGDDNGAKKIIKNYYENLIGKGMPILKSILSIFGLYKKFPKIFLAGFKKNYNESTGFKLKVYDLKNNTAKVDVLKCPYMEECKKYECPEITYLFCDTDELSFGNLHKKIHFNRTKTIGYGNELCDFKIKVTD